MAFQSILCCPPGQMNTLNRTRTSILRPNELVEIQGSYWPRISILSERDPSARKFKKVPTKVPRRIKKKMELIRQLKKSTPVPSPTHSPISPSFEASPLSSLSDCFDQNTSPCWKISPEKPSKTKTSSFTGRPVFPQLDNTTKPVGQSSSGLKGPRRRKSLKAVIAQR